MYSFVCCVEVGSICDKLHDAVTVEMCNVMNICIFEYAFLILILECDLRCGDDLVYTAVRVLVLVSGHITRLFDHILASGDTFALAGLVETLLWCARILGGVG